MKRFKAPNKKFQWTDGLRYQNEENREVLLCYVIRVGYAPYCFFFENWWNRTKYIQHDYMLKLTCKKSMTSNQLNDYYSALKMRLWVKELTSWIFLFQRMLLCTVVRIKMTMFDAGNSRTQSAEEFLRAYLDSEVKPLWPQGWMQTR